jgi:aspartate racemase
MKTIGLIGGMSWESTETYYRLINEGIKKRYCGSHSAKILMYSYDYYELDTMLHRGDMEGVSKSLVEKAIKLEQAGAEVLMILANTIHLISDDVKDAINIPLIHIVDETLKVLVDKKLKRPLLLGTKFTMGSDLYTKRSNQYNIEIQIPSLEEQTFIHKTIYEELIKGDVKSSSKEIFLSIIENHIKNSHIDSLILGCTEIPMLISQDDLYIPVLNTTIIHANAAIEQIIKK